MAPELPGRYLSVIRLCREVTVDNSPWKIDALRIPCDAHNALCITPRRLAAVDKDLDAPLPPPPTPPHTDI